MFTPVDALIPRGAGRVLRVGVIWCGPHCGPPSPGWPATTAPPGPPNPQHSPGQYVMVMLACPTFVIHLCDNWDRCSHVQPPAESGLSLWWWDLDLRWAEKEKMAHSLPFPYNPASLAPNTTPHHQVSQQPLCENIEVKKKSNLFDISTVSDKIGTFWWLSSYLRTCGLNIFCDIFSRKT